MGVVESTPWAGARAPSGRLFPGGQVHAGWQDMALDRLRLVAGVAVVMGLVALPLMLLQQPNELGVRAGTQRPSVLLPAWIVASAGLWALLRNERIAAIHRTCAGHAWVVASCLAVSLYRHWLPYDPSDVVRGASPVALALLFVAVVVPSTPRRTALVASIAALMDPLALWSTVALVGNPMPAWNQWVWLLAPTVLTVPVCVVMARVLFTLGEAVERARELGSYRLVERLGAGGMGEVWRAEHRTLARAAAVKLILTPNRGNETPDQAQQRALRFEREARATAALTSPHTIQVYDFGVSEDGTFYYVMELLDGRDVDEVILQGGALPAARVAHIMVQVCASLYEAHAAGLVHRDIKPANLFLCRVGTEVDFVKVLDFGLVMDSGTTEETRLTMDGMVVGSPAYMAPEMVRRGPVDGRTDLYSLGCAAYHMLTGRVVHPCATPVDALVAHIERDATPPSAIQGVDAPSALEELLLRCLSRDPAGRPGSAAELAEALLATGLPQQWTQELARAWWAGHEDAGAIGASDTLADVRGYGATTDQARGGDGDTALMHGA